jgi:HSP20 family molecular chaperone IbpA
VDGNKVKARYKDGVLEITMPIPRQLARKKIQIEDDLLGKLKESK